MPSSALYYSLCKQLTYDPHNPVLVIGEGLKAADLFQVRMGIGHGVAEISAGHHVCVIEIIAKNHGLVRSDAQILLGAAHAASLIGIGQADIGLGLSAGHDFIVRQGL